MRVVLFDIDGTLADCEHRVHHVQGPKKDWDSFYAGMAEDQPNQPIISLAIALRASGLPLIMTTGRPVSYRSTTLDWLDRHDLRPYELYMRHDGDHRPDEVVKREMLQTIRAAGFDPMLVVDDRASVVKMWREEGLTCLQCAAGDF